MVLGKDRFGGWYLPGRILFGFPTLGDV